VAVGDLDGVNGPDLAVANELGDDVSVLLNDGAGNFAPAMSYPAGAAPASVAIGDLDGVDGPDLAVANELGDDVSVLLNDGAGNFAPAMSYPAGTAPVSVAVGDFDGVNGPDLAVANELGDDVSVLLNDGAGNFAPAEAYAAGAAPASVAVGELDGVPGPDLAVANRSSDDVSVLLNLGDGTFAPAVAYDAGDAPASVATGDLDGVHGPDLAVANELGNDVSVLLNLGGSPEPLVATATGVGPNETVTLNPGGGLDEPIEEPLVVFTNGPDSEPATVTVYEVPKRLHPGALGYDAFNRTLTVEVSFEDNVPNNEDTYVMRVSLPFVAADVPPGDYGPEATELVWFKISAWTLGASGNTVNSPGYGETVGDRDTVVGPEPPLSFSDEIGDYGVYWNPDEERGFAWSNVDSVGDYAAGSPLCWSDLNGDGIVDLADYLILLPLLGTPCVAPPVGCPGDIFFDGVVDARDLAQLLAFWGTNCYVPPDDATIRHAVATVDNSAGEAEWGAGTANYEYLTWDLTVAVDPGGIGNWWTSTEALAHLDDDVYGALTFYQHPNDDLSGQWGAPPDSLLCPVFPAIEFDTWYIEATDLNPCTQSNPNGGAVDGAHFLESGTTLWALWIDLQGFPGPIGVEPFTIARYTILVDREDADCPGCHLDLVLVPTGEGGVDPVFGTIAGFTTHRFGLSNLIPFSFDVVDHCAADIDNNGTVNVVDFLDLLAAWPTGYGTAADIDRDGTVGVVDFLNLLARWGPCTP
jgi:hypothetical protein